MNKSQIKAFTLIEILIYISLLAFIVISIFPHILYQDKQNAQLLNKTIELYE